MSSCKCIQTPSLPSAPLPSRSRSLVCCLGVRPQKSRHPRQRGRWSSKRLTIPSSGPAFGSPLKSNVRPRMNPITNPLRHSSRCMRSRARRYLPQALHHRSLPSKPLGSFVIVGRAGRPSFAESARWRQLESKTWKASALRCFRLGTSSGGPTHLHSSKVQDQIRRRPCSSHCQRWYASPSK